MSQMVAIVFLRRNLSDASDGVLFCQYHTVCVRDAQSKHDAQIQKLPAMEGGNFHEGRSLLAEKRPEVILGDDYQCVSLCTACSSFEYPKTPR